MAGFVKSTQPKDRVHETVGYSSATLRFIRFIGFMELAAAMG
ncbi:hypothetical protein OH768_21945 [Streptomyces sp. NBC_01622]|nr:hypothetical protein OH768_21945 [Streptomyces sp. NBC_01622]